MAKNEKKPVFSISREAVRSLELEETWLDKRPKDAREISRFMHVEMAKLVDSSLDAIQSFTQLIKNGITPPSNVLLILAERFADYLERETISLDEAFCLKKKQRVGHPIKHQKAQQKRKHLLYAIWCLRKQNQNKGVALSIEDAAGEIINRLGADVEQEMLKTEYIRAKTQDILDGAYNALPDEVKASMVQNVPDPCDELKTDY